GRRRALLRAPAPLAEIGTVRRRRLRLSAPCVPAGQGRAKEFPQNNLTICAGSYCFFLPLTSNRSTCFAEAPKPQAENMGSRCSPFLNEPLSARILMANQPRPETLLQPQELKPAAEFVERLLAELDQVLL